MNATCNIQQFSLVGQHSDELSDVDEPFLFRETDLSRSAIHQLAEHDLLVKSHDVLGEPTEWLLADRTRVALAKIERDSLTEMGELILSLDEAGYRVIEQHADLLADLPNDVDEEFKAREHGLIGGVLQSLSTHGFVEREIARVGYPDTWTVTEQTRVVQRYLEREAFLDETEELSLEE